MSMQHVLNVAEKACGTLYFIDQGYEDVGAAFQLFPFKEAVI